MSTSDMSKPNKNALLPPLPRRRFIKAGTATPMHMKMRKNRSLVKLMSKRLHSRQGRQLEEIQSSEDDKPNRVVSESKRRGTNLIRNLLVKKPEPNTKSK